MNITHYLVLDSFQESYLREKLPDHEHTFSREILSPDTVHLAADAEVITLWVYGQIDAALLEQMPALKYIALRVTGYNNVDLAATSARDIPVSNVPQYGSETVAEYAFAHILNLTRKVSVTTAHMEGNTPIARSKLMGIDLSGKTLGVIGVGKIGKNAARIGKGFGMHLVGYDPYPDEAFAQECGLQYLSLEELLGQSDVITIHARLSEETHHLINHDNVGLIKKGAYLVNTSRGAIVETEVLYRALDEGILAGAGVDVFEGEEFLRFVNASFDAEKAAVASTGAADNFEQLLAHNVVVTPHNAFNTKDAVQRILDTTVANIQAYEAGTPQNLVQVS